MYQVEPVVGRRWQTKWTNCAAKKEKKKKKKKKKKKCAVKIQDKIPYYICRVLRM